MARIIQPIGDRIIIPKRRIKKPKYKMWMGIEENQIFKRPPVGASSFRKGILTPTSGGGTSTSASPSGGGPMISYDFSSDLITDIKNNVNVSGGKGYNGTGWDNNYGYYNASNTGSNDHYAQVYVDPAAGDWDQGGGVVVRCNGTTGYHVRGPISATTITYGDFNGTTFNETGQFTFPAATFTQDGAFWLRVQVTGNQLNAWVWGGASWTASSSNPVTDNAVSTGTSVGVILGWNGDSGTVSVDNLSADTDVGNLEDPA